MSQTNIRLFAKYLSRCRRKKMLILFHQNGHIVLFELDLSVLINEQLDFSRPLYLSHRRDCEDSREATLWHEGAKEVSAYSRLLSGMLTSIECCG